MGEGLKQRLIGAVVLLALLIILAPALFRGGETHPLVSSMPAPEAPRLEPPPVPVFVNQLSVPPDVVEVVSTSSEEVLEQNDAVKSSGVDDEGHLKAWSLQLATFADKSNARNLEKQLKSKGYSAYQKKSSTEKGKGKVFYRVYIGPEARPLELEQLKSKLKKEMGLEGILVRFVP